jgi:hypothetical protein
MERAPDTFVTLAPGKCRIETTSLEPLKSTFVGYPDGLFIEVERDMASCRPTVDAKVSTPDFSRNAIAARIGPVGEAAFKFLPGGVQELLRGSDFQTVFVAPCGATINLPLEMLHVPNGRTAGCTYDDSLVGLRKSLPRIHGLVELSATWGRQPSNSARKALIVGNPHHHGFQHRGKTSCPVCKKDCCPVCGASTHCGAEPLAGARWAADQLATSLLERGFQLSPNDDPLLDDEGTREAVLKALESDRVALWVQTGHGSRSDDGESAEYLCMAGLGRLYPDSVARARLLGTVVHYDCCFVGRTWAQRGGRFRGHPTAALKAGASCALSSVHPLWDDAAAEVST